MKQKFIRDILPIKELARQDRHGGRYPTRSRLGDKGRRGDNAVFFDDTVTLCYVTSSYVSLPTTLPISSSYISSDLKSSLSVINGSVTKAGTDQFVNIRTQNEGFTPYSEDKNISVSVDDSFQSNSNIQDIGLGFNGRLRDKTMLRIELPIVATTQLVASGGYYYNFATKTFDPIQMGTVPNGFFTGGSSNIFGPTSQLLFNCLGTQMSRNYQQSMTRLTTNAINAAWNYDSSFSLLQSASYEAASPIRGSNFITKGNNFVVEKAILEFGFSANSGWLNDSTQQFITTDVTNPPISFIGGPAITVALLNQIRPGKRELLMSSTIVPANDMTPWVNYLTNVGQGDKLFRGLGGFTNWSTPGVVVPGTTTFTGSLKMKMTSMIANGCTVGYNSTTNTIAPGQRSLLSINPFGRAMLDEAGRSIFGKEFTKPQNITSATGSALYNLPLPPFASAFGSTPVRQDRIISLDQNAFSPYLLRESDNLVIYVTSPKAALTGSELGGINFPTASYGVSINSGTMFLTLYGSQIAENTEFHDTLNQRLETNQVHEAIGFDPVVDSFDVNSLPELSGSTIGRISVSKAVPYLTYNSDISSGSFSGGTFFPTYPIVTSSNETSALFDNFSPYADGTSWSTQWGWTALKQIREIKKQNRNLNLLSSNELIADTRIPNPIMAMQACNPNFAINGGLDYGTDVSIIYAGMSASLGVVTGSVYTTNGVPGTGIADWYMTYPFESRYKNVQFTFANNLKSFKWKTINGGIFRSAVDNIWYDQLMLEVGNFKVGRILYSEGTAGYAAGGQGLGWERPSGMGMAEFLKVFFGIGDGVSPDCNQFVTPRGFGFPNYAAQQAGGNGKFAVCAEIRGWRYGLVSAFPMYSSAVFRRSTYGQVRDMLEQRQDTKFYDVNVLASANGQPLLPGPVAVKFVDANGKPTLPEYTRSSNLSVEATSSCPYTDGKVRNREEPIFLARSTQTVVVV